jgi:hypothetical protein
MPCGRLDTNRQLHQPATVVHKLHTLYAEPPSHCCVVHTFASPLVTAHSCASYTSCQVQYSGSAPKPTAPVISPIKCMSAVPSLWRCLTCRCSPVCRKARDCQCKHCHRLLPLQGRWRLCLALCTFLKALCLTRALSLLQWLPSHQGCDCCNSILQCCFAHFTGLLPEQRVAIFWGPRLLL